MAEVSKNSVTTTLITENEHGQRLDNLLLKKCKGVPKSHVYSIVRSGQVRVNGRRAEVSYRLQSGDLLRMPPLRIAVAEHEVVAGAELKVHLPVIFEDEGLLVVDKPAGIAVHGGSGESFGVIEALRRQRPQARFLELAHRLDRETSGVLLLGKKRSVLLALHEMFRAGGLGGGARGADKRYLVLVCGRWMDPLRNVRLPLLKYLQASGERRVRVSEEGKAAHTVFRLLARWQHFSLLEAELRTGRTHQIRVHLAQLGYPIAGDEKYGDFALNKALSREGLKRMFLHAWKMRLPHPLHGTELRLEAALPAALNGFLQGISVKETQDYGEKI
ncbi:MAG: RluA family pseudouridine synthase [Candidatus Accumulibacter sp.]|jgi:23S rRNA pseudouridine955/2504/2580 synthase|uniref:RluA family pseudouridine synthase n=1 Tax=Candidatus Accumulibacter TaxID=327159 RepID=UPI00258702F8|nr:RluA family pseudouridine synthase [Accumulibacter sp.]MBK8116228.1 RluA family pseudouridine synthase [Accumulibacter sp.]MBK8386447.1 RluA family pseudouridine synthase [Accumulibacter sp.]